MRVERKHGLWTVNGETWEDVEETNFQRVFGNPKPYDVEIWDLVNESGGWFHPLHIHLIDAKIIGRNTTRGRQGARRGRAAARTSSTSARTRRSPRSCSSPPATATSAAAT